MPRCRVSSHIVVLATATIAAAAAPASRLTAQDRPSFGAGTPSTQQTSQNSGLVEPNAALRTFREAPLATTSTTVWIGTALSTRTASPNERFDGAAFHVVGVQFSRSLFRRHGLQFSWLVEVLPAIVASVGAPPHRIPPISIVSSDFEERRREAARRLAPYQLRDVFGVGLAPVGAQVTRQLSPRVSALVNVTAGAALFTHVVPYGKATRANFTATPTVALELGLTERYALSTGYSLHHVSNAGFGVANPGLNAHMITLRLTRARGRTHTNARSRE